MVTPLFPPLPSVPLPPLPLAFVPKPPRQRGLNQSLEEQLASLKAAGVRARRRRAQKQAASLAEQSLAAAETARDDDRTLESFQTPSFPADFPIQELVESFQRSYGELDKLRARENELRSVSLPPGLNRQEERAFIDRVTAENADALATIQRRIREGEASLREEERSFGLRPPEEEGPSIASRVLGSLRNVAGQLFVPDILQTEEQKRISREIGGGIIEQVRGGLGIGAPPEEPETIAGVIGRSIAGLGGFTTEQQAREEFQGPLGPAIALFPEMIVGGRALAEVMQVRGGIAAGQAVVRLKPTAPTKAVIPIPSTDDIVRQTATAKSAFGGALSSIRSRLGKAVTSASPYEDLAAIHGTMQDAADSSLSVLLAKATLLSDTGRLGVSRPVMRISPQGIVTDTAVRQIKKLPGGKESMAAHDVVEFSARYSMQPQMRAFVNEVRSLSRRLAKYADLEGVLPHRLKGETDWVYLHRAVRSLKQDRVRELAERGQQALVALGQPLAREVDEAPWVYLQRIMRGLSDGTIAPSRDLDDIANATLDLIDVSVRRQSLQGPRLHKTVADGLEAGVQYEPNPMAEIRIQGRLVYNEVIKKRIGELLQATLNPKTRRELVSAGVRAEADTTARLAANALRLKRALVGKPANAFSPKSRTYQRISEDYPELLDRWTALRKLRGEGAKDARVAGMKGLRDDVDELAKATKGEAVRGRQKMTQALLAVETEEKGRVIGIPGISGKFIETQVIGGKQVLGRDIADNIRDIFGWIPPGPFETHILRPLSVVASAYRLGKASFDMGIQMIQMWAVMGIDTTNAVLFPTTALLKTAGLPVKVVQPTAIFPKSAVRSYWSFINPRYEAEYWTQADNIASVARRVQHRSLVQRSEFTEGIEIVERLAARVPVGRGIISGVSRQTFGRADAAWSGGRNVAGNEMWKAFEGLARSTNDLDQLGAATNVLTGVMSLRGMGTPRFTRSALNAIGFFSPRYTFAQVAMIDHIFRGGMSTRLALKAVIGMVMANTAITTAFALALGQKPRLNPLPKSVGGDGGDVWTLGIGKRRFGLGGPLYSPLRFAVNTVSAAFDQPSDLYPTKGMSNPVIRAVRAKVAGPTKLMWDYFTGRQFTGETVRGMGDLKPTAETIRWARDNISPIWVEQMLQERGGGPMSAVAEWFGFRTHPESFWTLYRAQAEEEDSSGRDFADISDTDLALLRAQSPTLQEAWDAAQEDSQKRGWNTEQTEYHQKRDDATDAYHQNISDGWALLQTDPTKDMRWFREQIIQDGRRTLRGRLTQINTDFPDVVEGFEQREDAEHPEDIIYNGWWDLFLASEFYDPVDGSPRYKRRDGAMLAFRDNMVDLYGQDNWDKAAERRQVSQLKAPFPLQEYWWVQANEKVRAYSSRYEAIAGDDPVKIEVWERTRGHAGELRERDFELYPWLAEMERMNTFMGQAMREDAELEAILYRWNYIATIGETSPNQGQQLDLRPWEALRQ